MTKDDILKLAEVFGAHKRLKLSSVSTYAAKDGKWLPSLKGSASCTLRKAAEVTLWFSENWPEGLAWPDGIVRPQRRVTKSKKRAA